MKKIIKIVAVGILFLSTNCGIKETEFNKQKWNDQTDGFYENRKNMVKDLLKNHLTKGMKYSQLTELIGEPENYANLKDNTVAYRIMENYGWNIDPIETKILKIELTKDSLVKKYKIEHWKN
ncbi:hypothetical protein LPB03_13525 [Polaribacter vadi]|uniref:Uncharacterized protein n=1 Tax=Polaribacter vadi TaxID=1774273 RepID=A0A1B8U2C1_9FLAO|nr:hypothetical protein [Polaribacter vadi]AOW18411.1 hypothetical protein LPB03_13525 [Polaribacter vadi]OBY66018.1 hypothetical protein LPB3_02055 [Polaribacter vadi]